MHSSVWHGPVLACITPASYRVPATDPQYTRDVATGGAVVRRCDYNGVNYDNFDWFEEHPDGDSTKFLPEGCAYEAGGVIGANADSSGASEYTGMTTTFFASVSPRATGVHTFWVEADDGAVVYVVYADGSKRRVVDNSGEHAARWRHGSVTLTKGNQYSLQVYWANGKHHGGKLRVMLDDPLTEDQAAGSIAQILV